MKTTNNACFTHLCGNCPCSDKNAIKFDIGTQFRTPKKGDTKRWRDFIIMLATSTHHYYVGLVKEHDLLKKFAITDKMLEGRSTYKNYREHRQSTYKKNSNQSQTTHNMNRVYWKIKQGRQLASDPVTANRPYFADYIKAYQDNEERRLKGKKHLDIDAHFKPLTEEERILARRKEFISETPDIFRKK